MTDPEPITAAAADTAHALHRDIVALRRTVVGGWARLGAALRAMRDRRLYVLLGHDTFESYLADPDVTISRRTAYRVMALSAAIDPSLPAPACATVAHDGTTPAPAPAPLMTADDIADIGIVRAEIIAPVLRDAAGDDDARAAWVADARALSVGDLRMRVREARGDAVTDREITVRRIAARIGGLAARLIYDPDPAGVLDTIAAAASDAAERLRRAPEEGATEP